MKSGEIKLNYHLNKCKCGSEPVIIWHYIKGTANRIHYFAKCNNCLTKTRDRRKCKNAINDWNTNVFQKNK